MLLDNFNCLHKKTFYVRKTFFISELKNKHCKLNSIKLSIFNSEQVFTKYLQSMLINIYFQKPKAGFQKQFK